MSNNQVEPKSNIQVNDEEKIVLESNHLGSLTQIAENLWRNMLKETDKNGQSDLTLDLEACSKGIREIIELNNIAE